MQTREKISPSKSSAESSPVIADSEVVGSGTQVKFRVAQRRDVARARQERVFRGAVATPAYSNSGRTQ